MVINCSGLEMRGWQTFKSNDVPTFICLYFYILLVYLFNFYLHHRSRVMQGSSGSGGLSRGGGEGSGHGRGEWWCQCTISGACKGVLYVVMRVMICCVSRVGLRYNRSRHKSCHRLSCIIAHLSSSLSSITTPGGPSLQSGGGWLGFGGGGGVGACGDAQGDTQDGCDELGGPLPHRQAAGRGRQV